MFEAAVEAVILSEVAAMNQAGASLELLTRLIPPWTASLAHGIRLQNVSVLKLTHIYCAFGHELMVISYKP